MNKNGRSDFMSEEEKEFKKKAALVDYNMAKTEFRKSKFKIIKMVLIILVILLVIGILIRVIHGRVYYSVSFLSLNRSVEYKLYVNSEHETIAFEEFLELIKKEATK